MKTYRFTIDGHELSIRMNCETQRISELKVDGAVPQLDANEMARYAAVISLALLEHDTAVMHDDETGIITLGHQTSRWANPADSMNERGSLLKNLIGW